MRSARFSRAAVVALSALVLLPLLPVSAEAQTARRGSDTGFELPRFASFKSRTVNLRVGPGRDYRVDWVYTKPGLPVEIVQEFDNWRRVRDAEGTEGWVFAPLLAGRRTAVAAPWLDKDAEAPLELRRKPRGDAEVTARIEPGVTGTITECDGEWCRFEPHAAKGEVVGWLPQVELWGAYPGEAFED